MGAPFVCLCLVLGTSADCLGNPTTSVQGDGTTNQTLTPEQIRQYAVGHIQGKLDILLEDPAVYLKTARDECKLFPEGTVYPYVMPACAYVNLALAGEIPKEDAIPKVRALLEMGVQEVAVYVRAPNRDLLRFNDYMQRASFLGILNLGLSAYPLICDDNHFKAINDHLSVIFLDALERGNGASLEGWPNLIWHMDTTFVLASLDLWKAPHQKGRVKAAYALHMAWRKKIATLANGLTLASAGRKETRGCDIATQVPFLANMDPVYAKQLYTAFCQRHWIDYGFLYGFTEWEKGVRKGTLGDVDSGPVIMEIGSTASGMGIAAAKSVGDIQRYNRLLYEINWVTNLIRSAPSSEMGKQMFTWIGQYVPGGIDPKYYSGFLYGDAFLFYSLTWTPWPEGNIRGR